MDTGIILAVVVVDRQVGEDQTLLPVPAIWAYSWGTGSTSRPDHWCAASKCRELEPVQPL